VDSRKRRWPKRVISVSVALLLAVGVGEVAAAKRDRGGFPHFNGYLADKDLGVRLRPNFSTAISFRSNPVGRIKVNGQGFRGVDWPQDGTGEIAVIGDSQVFGLGVNDDQTTPAILAKLTNQPVLNMGVPTYGPYEYLAMIDEAAKRHPSQIVMVINFGNDIFELDHPDRNRHVVMDGWALRGGKVPSHVSFPGRSWVYGRSHLFYAIRQLVGKRSKSGIVPKDPKASLLKVPQRSVETQAAPVGTSISETDRAVTALLTAQDDVYQLSFAVAPIVGLDGWSEAVRVGREGAIVGDVYQANTATEAAPQLTITSEWLRAATDFRDGAAQRLSDWASANPKKDKAKRAKKYLADLAVAEANYTKLTGFPANPETPSAFRPFIAEAQRRSAVAGAELTMVALPLDIQLDPQRFVSYGEQPEDLSSSLVLLEDMCRDSEHLGVRCLNAASALKESGEGTFLDGDLHLTPKGHTALAEAIQRTLTKVNPHATPFTSPQQGRTRFPTVKEFAAGTSALLAPFRPSAATTGAKVQWNQVQYRTSENESLTDDQILSKVTEEQKRCLGRSLREYVMVSCSSGPFSLATVDRSEVPLPGAVSPIGIRVVEGSLDRFTWTGPDASGFIVPRDPKTKTVVDFFWLDGQVDRLTITAGLTPSVSQPSDSVIGSWASREKSRPPLQQLTRRAGGDRPAVYATNMFNEVGAEIDDVAARTNEAFATAVSDTSTEVVPAVENERTGNR
jgi:SGNH hydrolase-like domain, acetyltransferase AlgX